MITLQIWCTNVESSPELLSLEYLPQIPLRLKLLALNIRDYKSSGTASVVGCLVVTVPPKRVLLVTKIYLHHGFIINGEIKLCMKPNNLKTDLDILRNKTRVFFSAK